MKSERTERGRKRGRVGRQEEERREVGSGREGKSSEMKRGRDRKENDVDLGDETYQRRDHQV